MKKKFSIFLLLFILAISISPIIKKTEVYALDAKAYAVMSAEDKQLLNGSNEHTRLAMASTTKIVTAIVAIENTQDLNHMVAVDDRAVGIEGTSIYLQKGEKLPFNELLLGLILASGNDCAVAIACDVAGSPEAFVDMMNDFVINLGLKDTHFDNPHGLDSDTHYTSAYDLAYITSYALQNETFAELVKTKTAVISGNDQVEHRYLKHKNRLLFTDDNCIGVKTGFTDNAGRCLVHATKKDNMTIVSVVLNCGPMFETCDALDKQARNEYIYKEFVTPYSFVGNSIVENGNIDQMGLAVVEGYSAIIKKSDVDKYRVEYDIPSSLTAPIKKDDIVGSVKILFEDNVIKSLDVYAIEDCENIDLKYYLDSIIDGWRY